MRKLLLFLFSALLIAGPAAAQTSDCGNGVPCGPIPWRLPVLPNLPSPSPMPTLAVTTSSINPGAPTSTPVPINTPTPLGLDTSEIEENLNAINLMLQQEPVGLETDFSLFDEPLIDLDFTDPSIWTEDCPTGWVCIQNPPNSDVNNVSQGLQVIRVSTAGYARTQSILTLGTTYGYTVTVAEITGNMRIGELTGSGSNIISSPGVHTGTFTPDTNRTFALQASGNNVDFTVSSLVVYIANSTFEELGTNAGTFFGYARGLSGDSFGPLAPLIVLAGTAFVVVVTVKITTFLLPVLAALFGIIRKVVSVILEFLPL